jgi:hypothetical protein
MHMSLNGCNAVVQLVEELCLSSSNAYHGCFRGVEMTSS